MKQTIGGCLLAMGILIAGATGLCMSMFFNFNTWRGFEQAFNFLGIPFLLGVAMVVVGVVMIRGSRMDRW